MTTRFLRFTLPALGLLVCSGAALAQPIPALCTVPRCIPLVGKTAAGGVDPAGQFTCTIVGPTGPIGGCPVTIDFGGCTDICIGDQPSNNYISPTGPIAIGPGKTATSITDPVGVATFRIVGGATNIMGCSVPFSGAGCVRVLACGVFIVNATANAYNENNSLGAGGVNGADLASWLGDFFCPGYKGRSDFDCSGVLAGNDLSAWLMLYFAGGSITGASGNVAPCP